MRPSEKRGGVAGGGPEPARAQGDRGAPPNARCPHAPACVGCPWLGVPYGEQLRRKAALLDEALRTHGLSPSAAFVREPAAGSARALGYRCHARLVFRRRRGGDIMLGVYRPGTHSVLPAERCRVHHPGLEPVLVALLAAVERLGVAVHDERTGEGGLRYALARIAAASGAVHLTLVTAADPLPGLPALTEALRATASGLEALFVAVNTTRGNALLDGPPRRIFGPRALSESFGPITAVFRPDTFSQANPATATHAYGEAARWLGRRSLGTVVDLFCGVGVFGLRVAPPESRLFGIEVAPAAVECARDNARRLGRRAEYAAGPVDAHLRQLLPRLPVGGETDLLLLNPPRRGLGAEGHQAVGELTPRRIAYLSCNPESLASDLAILASRGFHPRRIRAFDMLPQTPHVEALALLERS